MSVQESGGDVFLSPLTALGKGREWPTRRRAGAGRELRGSLGGHVGGGCCVKTVSLVCEVVVLVVVGVLDVGECGGEGVEGEMAGRGRGRYVSGGLAVKSVCWCACRGSMSKLLV